MVDQQTIKNSQFYLTSSEFSEFAHLEYDFRDLNSATANNPESRLKVANFKRIDWDALEGKLLPDIEKA